MVKGKTITPSNTIERQYSAVLVAMVKRMNKELLAEIPKAYARRDDEFLPDMAADESAAVWLRRYVNRFFSRWQKRFDKMAEVRAKWFTEQTEKASTKQIKAMLKEVGFTVEFRTTSYVNNILQASMAENVDLIKSIPAQVHDKVLGIVSRGIQAGNDQMFIKEELQKQFGVTERRARFIARDQSRKAMSALAEARCNEGGIVEGYWRHRSGSKVPRTSHKGPKMNGVRYVLAEGLHDPNPKINRKVKPGELPGCLCSFSPALDSFNPKIAQDSVSFSISKELMPQRYLQEGLPLLLVSLPRYRTRV